MDTNNDPLMMLEPSASSYFIYFFILVLISSIRRQDELRRRTLVSFYFFNTPTSHPSPVCPIILSYSRTTTFLIISILEHNHQTFLYFSLFIGTYCSTSYLCTFNRFIISLETYVN